MYDVSFVTFCIWHVSILTLVMMPAGRCQFLLTANGTGGNAILHTNALKLKLVQIKLNNSVRTATENQESPLQISIGLCCLAT